MADLVESVLLKLTSAIIPLEGLQFNYFFSNLANGFSIKGATTWDPEKAEHKVDKVAGDPVSGPLVKFVNRTWLSHKISLNNAGADRVDFQSKQAETEVKKWAEQESNGIITDFPKEGVIDKNTLFMYGTLFDVNGLWKEPFNPSNSKTGNFYTMNGTTIHVPFMTSKAKHYFGAYIITGIQFKVLRLPFKSEIGDVSVLLVLPRFRSQLDPLRNLIGYYEKWFWDKYLPTEKVDVAAVSVPKFEVSFRPKPVEYSVEGKPYKYAFLNKAVIKMSESGARAAGVVVGTVKEDSGRGAPSAGHLTWGPGGPDFFSDGRFDCHHNFLFFIRENKNKRMWFNGCVVDPTKIIN